MQQEHLHDLIERKARGNPGYAIAYALLRLAEGQSATATALKYLGNGDAATTLGAIEAFGLHVGEKLDALTQLVAQSSQEEE